MATPKLHLDRKDFVGGMASAGTILGGLTGGAALGSQVALIVVALLLPIWPALQTDPALVSAVNYTVTAVVAVAAAVTSELVRRFVSDTRPAPSELRLGQRPEKGTPAK